MRLRILSVFICAVVISMNVGLCREYDFEVEQSYRGKNHTLFPMSDGEMLDLAHEKLQHFLTPFIKTNDHTPLDLWLLWLIEGNPDLAVEVMEKVMPLIKRGKWNGKETAQVIKAFNGMEEGKVSFLCKKLMPLINEYHWDGFDIAKIIPVFKGMDKKKITFLFKELDFWVEEWKWGKWEKGELIEVIEAFKGMDEKQFQFLYRKLKFSWNKKGWWDGKETAQVIKAFNGMEEERRLFLYEKFEPWIERYKWGSNETLKIITVFKDMDEEDIKIFYEKLKPWMDRFFWNGNEILKIITALRKKSGPLIPYVIGYSHECAHRFYGRASLKTLLNCIALFQSYDDKTEAKRMKNLILERIKGHGFEQEKFFIQALAYHAREERKDVFLLQIPSFIDNWDDDDLGVLAFIPKVQWDYYLHKRKKNIIKGSAQYIGEEYEMKARLLDYYQLLVRKNNQDRNRFLMFLHHHWKKVLQSSRMDARWWCSTFITENKSLLGLGEKDGNGLLQKAHQSFK